MNRITTLIITIALSLPVNAGDIATERTQAATAVLITTIQDITRTIRDIEENIRTLEELAALDIQMLPGFVDLPGVVDLFDILRDIEAVIEAGEGMAHTYNLSLIHI